MSEQEVEVKFYLSNLPAMEQQLKYQGAELVQARVHEINYRYDTPDGALTRAHRVLRLRQDQHAVLTYKGPAEAGQPVSVRQEIEVEVSSFTAAAHLFEALGYQVSMMYEKQRTTYNHHGVKVTLDEMPYGNFMELEGPDAETIQTVANELGLDWEARVVDSYLAMFARLKEAYSLKMRYLIFSDFNGVTITADQLGLKAADRQHSPRTLS